MSIQPKKKKQKRKKAYSMSMTILHLNKFGSIDSHSSWRVGSLSSEMITKWFTALAKANLAGFFALFGNSL